MSKMVPTGAGSQVPLTYMAMIENLSLFRGTPRANLCHTLGKIASNPSNFRALTDAGAISALSHVLSSEEVGSLSRSAACECLNVFARVSLMGCTEAVSYPPIPHHPPPLPPPPPPALRGTRLAGGGLRDALPHSTDPACPRCFDQNAPDAYGRGIIKLTGKSIVNLLQTEMVHLVHQPVGTSATCVKSALEFVHILANKSQEASALLVAAGAGTAVGLLLRFVDRPYTKPTTPAKLTNPHHLLHLESPAKLSRRWTWVSGVRILS